MVWGRFDEGSARVSPGFHQGSTSGPGWFEVMFHENSTRIHQVLQGKVPFQHGSSRVPRGSARAAGWSGVV